MQGAQAPCFPRGDTMARYEHLPIYKTAMDLAVYLEQVGYKMGWDTKWGHVLQSHIGPSRLRCSDVSSALSAFA